MKRYFLVFYKAVSNEWFDVLGETSFITDGCYLNRKYCNEQICKDGTKEVCFTNIIELKEEDYKTYPSTE